MSASSENSKLNSSIVKQKLDDSEAIKLIKWSKNVFGDRLIMTTSFGIQSAVMLHLTTKLIPHIPIVWIDTGYFPKETYQFAEQLTQRLNLNLKVYQSSISQARMEALHGKLWEQDNIEALNKYDYIRKVEPMQRALEELNAQAWLAGLRSDQTKHRQTLSKLAKQGNIYKIHPILNWNSRDIYQYLTDHNLPYHPYFDLGYVTVGDWHSSRPIATYDTHERDTRFQGIKQECGLHLSRNIAAKSQQLPEITKLDEIKIPNSKSENFCAQDLEVLALTAQWCLKDIESNEPEADKIIKIKLLTEITQELKKSLKEISNTGKFIKKEVAEVSTPEEEKYWKIINKSTINLKSLVNDILDLGLTKNQDVPDNSSSLVLESLCDRIINGLNYVKSL